MEKEKVDYREVGRNSLVYKPSKVSWSISEHVSSENPILTRLMIYLLIVLFLSFSGYAYFAEIAISLKVSGSLGFEQATTTVLNKNELTINRILVENNKPVKKGQRLLLGKGQLSSSLLKEMKSRKSRIEKLLQQDKQGYCSSSCMNELVRLSEKSFSFNPKFRKVSGSLKKYISKLSGEYKAYINALSERRDFKATSLGLRSKRREIEKKINKIRKNRAEKILKLELSQLKGELATVTSQVRERKSAIELRIRQSRNVFEVSLKSYGGQVRDYISSHQLKSPTSGTLVYMDDISEGQFLTAGTKIFKILPKGEKLFGKSLLSNKDISKVKVGDKVKISINALPEREYGPVWGKISLIAIEPKEDPESKELKYEITIALKKQSLRNYKEELKRFKLGMSYEAKIVTRYESLLRVGIRKLLNIKDEYLGEIF